MKIGKLVTTALFALSISGITLAATSGPQGAPGAQGERSHRGHMMGRFSVEHVAMHNIMAELLSQKTGRSVAEIKALFENSEDPRAAVDKLGLSHDDMRALFQQAHQTFITKAEAAGLITAEQAKQLRSEPLPEPREHHGPPPGEGE